MNIIELQDALDKLGVPRRWYSINGDLTSDIHILNHVYTYWEYFYFDEKGQENGYKRFENEHDACMYFYQILADETIYYNINKLRNS